MKELELKYGCNPNQKPSKIFVNNGNDLPITVLNGKPGYINFMDAFNGWQLVKELKGLLDNLWNQRMNSGSIANTNSIFNLGCSLLALPFLKSYAALSHKIVKDEVKPAGKYDDKIAALNKVFFNTPAIAFGSCYDCLHEMLHLACYDGIHGYCR